MKALSEKTKTLSEDREAEIKETRLKRDKSVLCRQSIAAVYKPYAFRLMQLAQGKHKLRAAFDRHRLLLPGYFYAGQIQPTVRSGHTHPPAYRAVGHFHHGADGLECRPLRLQCYIQQVDLTAHHFQLPGAHPFQINIPAVVQPNRPVLAPVADAV